MILKSETSPVTDDPFAAVSYEIHISGRLTLLRTPRGTCGEWTCAEFLTTHPGWHRRLTAHAFLWLRDAVHRAIESGNLSSEFADALQRLEWIRSVGIEYGAFTPDDVAEHQHAPERYAFNSGLPHWADEI